MRGDPALGDGECHAFGSAGDTELVPHFSEDALDVTLGVSEAFGEVGECFAVGEALQAGKLHLVGRYRQVESAKPSHGDYRNMIHPGFRAGCLLWFSVFRRSVFLAA